MGESFGFDPAIEDWFQRRFGSPTAVQAAAWPRIAAGEHLLVSAPTGSGKTLTAFLWAIDQLARGAWEPGGIRVLYVSPLKALNNDIRTNLLGPLGEIAPAYGERWPQISVATRSGDTPERERRRILKRPPEFLVTTPESLNLMLTAPRARRILTGVRTVILDEIHAVAGNRRGSYLMTAVERLVELSGEVQRIALSATLKKPLDEMAAFVGGFDATSRQRPVTVVDPQSEKKVEVSVHATLAAAGDSVWPNVVRDLKAVIARNRSTLVFVNNRALCERLVRLLNRDEPEPVAYAHHGSLARELRELVEAKLKAGDLKAIVATSSLELGIDIGDLDEVVLVQSPRTLNSAIQRVGRAGHAVGETSVGRIHPTHGRDYLDAAVLAPRIEAREVETLRPVRNALDVLAQVVVACCAIEPWQPDRLFDLMRRSWCYRTLRREAFDLVVAMLLGRYAEARIRELRPRLRQDPTTGELTGRPGTLPLIYRSGGVIPDRGYFTIRVRDSGARLGELDEEFVWERRLGDEFSVGAQTWRIERITRDEVQVVPGGRREAVPPFWRAEAQARDFELCELVGQFLERADAQIGQPAFLEELVTHNRLDATAAETLVAFLQRQRAATASGLPHRRRIVLEICRGPSPQGEYAHVALHACWGARVLRPFGIALAAAWEQRYGALPETFANDDCLMIQVPEGFDASTLMELVRADNVEALLRSRLESTGFFGARFRECCQRALLLPRSHSRGRMPLWLNRLRAHKLLQSTAKFADFPMRAEAWRTCLEEEFDVERLVSLLEEVREGEIELVQVRTHAPSPFAEGVAWRSANQYMYEDDRGLAPDARSLSDQVLQEVLTDSALRPRLEPETIADLEAKLLRTAPDYAPVDAADLFDWVEECLLAPTFSVEFELPETITVVDWGSGWWVAGRQLPRVERARAGDERALRDCLAEYLRSRGPRTASQVAVDWGLSAARIDATLLQLVEDGTLIADRLRAEATETEYCDRENLERLLRMRRAAARPQFRALPVARFPLFLATYQGLLHRGTSAEDLPARLEPLLGFPAPAALWEEAILPARLTGYRRAWLDDLMRESDLTWVGTGKQQVALAFRDDLRLLLGPLEEAPRGWPDPLGRYELLDLQQSDGASTAEWTTRIWEWAFEGRVVNDTFAALRKGIENRFRPSPPAKGRRGFRSWQSTRPLVGTWRALLRPPVSDRLEEAEDDRQRVRLLLARYGVCFREICSQELPLLRWGRLLRTLRHMELAGEVLAGHFFEGIEGLQFCSHEALRLLQAPLDEAQVFWHNAAEPASACGLGPIQGLPSRLPTTWLIWEGPSLVAVVRKGGREVEWRSEPRADHLDFFRELLTRDFRNPSRILIERMDGNSAADHKHAPVLREYGFHADRGSLILEKSYEES